MWPKELRLPPGYRLDRSDPDVWALRRSEGSVVAHFSSRGASREDIEKIAREDYEEGEEDPNVRYIAEYFVFQRANVSRR